MAIDPKKTLLFNHEFLRALGMFHGAWSSLEAEVDYSIGQFLGITDEQTHLLTSGMLFGRKAQLLAGLIARSDHAKKDILLGSLNKIRGEVKRDWLVHSYMTTTADTVTFIHRNSGGEYNINKLTFTLIKFVEHVHMLTKAGSDFQRAMGFTVERMNEFFAASERATVRPKTSPAKPDDKA